MHPAFFARGSCNVGIGSVYWDVTLAKIPDKVPSSRHLHTVALWGPLLPLGDFLAPVDRYFASGNFCTVRWRKCLVSTPFVVGTTGKIFNPRHCIG